MRIALINSGLGLLAAAAALRRMRPDADLVLAMDPDGMPWGPRRPDDIAARSLACARAAAIYRPDVLVFACNTGSVHALGVLRAEFEPGLPVVGTVPAIKPAAAAGQPAAIWATAATTGSAYQRGLIEQFAAGVPVAEVACPGLADAIHAGDEARIGAAITAAAAQTPPGTGAVVLGCTEYELVADRIRAAVLGAVPFGSAEAVAAQALRRAADARPLDGAPHSGAGAIVPAVGDGTSRSGAEPGTDRDGTPTDPGRDGAAADPGRDGPAIDPGRDGAVADPGQDGAAAGRGRGEVRVLLSGRPGQLPPAALRYREGRLLATIASGVPAS
jgi:glutamate racemase